MNALIVWIRGREYIVSGSIKGPDRSVGIYSSYLVIEELKDVETGQSASFLLDDDSIAKLSDAELAEINTAYWNAAYYEERCFAFSWWEEWGEQAHNAFLDDCFKQL